MDESQNALEENRRLRRTMRDLVALSTLPAIWVGLGASGIVRSLADVLLNTLSLDLIYVRLRGTTGEDIVEVVRSRHGADAAHDQVVKAAVAPLWNADVAAPPANIPDPFKAGTLQVAVTRFGIGDDQGIVIAASRDAHFPTEHDRLLLSVGANQTAIVVQRRRAEEALRDADRRKDEFLAMLAHELRNPLAPLRNGLQILRLMESSKGTVAEARSMMERQLSQMVRLVDDLLDVSRITRNKLELRKQRVDLASVIQSAIETSRPLIEQAGHDLSLSLPPTSVYVDADATRLAQVFSNLLNNSAKYTEPGGRIALIAEIVDREAVVRVRDNGLGIPADALPRIFEMFSQVDRSLERAQGGLGVGLTLVRRLVELHGGTVEARSDGPGHGSEFLVRLPVANVQIDQECPRGGGMDLERPPKRRIMIVDDNEDAAMTLAIMLKIMGHDTHVAHDGFAAIEATADFHPDIILLDLGLPKMNGYEVCRHLREQPWSNGVVIVALTGWAQEEDRRRTAEAGFDHHFVKPVEFTALQEVLARTPTVAAQPAS